MPAAALHGESGEAIAAAGNRLSRLLRDMGIQASPVEVIEAAVAENANNGSFQDITARHVSLRKRGKSHGEALGRM